MPARRINGGGTASREDAEHGCIEAISFALQGDPNDSDSDAVTLDVRVAPAAWPRRSKSVHLEGPV